MKRISCLILGIFLILSTISVFAEEVDYSAMEYEELIAIKHAIDAELDIRTNQDTIVLQKGKYIVGRDIQPGKYYFMMKSLTPKHNEDFGITWIYPSIEVYTKDQTSGYLSLSAEARKQIVNLFIYTSDSYFPYYIELNENNVIVAFDIALEASFILQRIQ